MEKNCSESCYEIDSNKKLKTDLYLIHLNPLYEAYDVTVA